MTVWLRLGLRFAAEMAHFFATMCSASRYFFERLKPTHFCSEGSRSPGSRKHSLTSPRYPGVLAPFEQQSKRRGSSHFPVTRLYDQMEANTLSVINSPLGFALKVEPKYDYGGKRELTKQTLDHFGGAVCVSKGTFPGRFLIALHNASGALVGYAGR